MALMPWPEMVERIERGDDAGIEALYAVFRRGVRFWMCSQLGPQDLDDRLHDTFLVVWQAIRDRKLREPDRLMGYVRKIVTCQVANQIQENILRRQGVSIQERHIAIPAPSPTPEDLVNVADRQSFAASKLAKLGGIDRAIITRFYVDGTPWMTIARDLKLTPTQFRLRKTRALAKLKPRHATRPYQRSVTASISSTAA